jgi:hypothetical protein
MTEPVWDNGLTAGPATGRRAIGAAGPGGGPVAARGQSIRECASPKHYAVSRAVRFKAHNFSTSWRRSWNCRALPTPTSSWTGASTSAS